MATISNIDIGSTSITTTGVVTTGTWAASTPIGLAYGGTNNAALAASNGGILYSTATTLAVKAGTATATQALVSAASTTPAWTTNIWPSTVASGSLLGGGTANTISAITSVQGGVLYGTSAPAVVTSALTNGQILSYNAGVTIRSIVGGTGVTVANGAGSITISTPSIVNQASSSVTLAAGNLYLINNGASLVTLTLPSSPTAGDRYIIIGASSGGWKVAQPTVKFVQLPGGAVTTTGTSGSISSTNQYDAIAIVASPTANQYIVYWLDGNLIYV